MCVDRVCHRGHRKQRSHRPRGSAPLASPRRPEALPCDHLGQADHHGPQDPRIARASPARSDEYRPDAEPGLSSARMYRGGFPGRGALPGPVERSGGGPRHRGERGVPAVHAAVREGLSHDRRRRLRRGRLLSGDSGGLSRLGGHSRGELSRRRAKPLRLAVSDPGETESWPIGIDDDAGEPSGVADHRARRGTNSAWTQARSRRFQSVRSAESSWNTQRATSSARIGRNPLASTTS